jgi:trehalose monomycolate/heme transporter
VFLRSMGYGAIAVVAVALVAALTMLPALLAVLGPRVNSLRVPRLGRPRSTGGVGADCPRGHAPPVPGRQ